ncbi:hypothetical protein [Borrelia miyamotoi]|uniref:Lipoprotein n=1 Tax=Borrelia miyamotoi TaxID=47466 RepID=A0AAQ2X1V5_9SPIR|nr:hypothetical protein [Borrelia miyamotoi]AJA67234.1 hypothetical protein I871_B07 [Borrelia miyamotoi LB-2001]AOW96312.1 hypothetical protein AXH25_04590 [Borrelia miyamotoi]WAZ85786.1 hypothetical protein O5400_05400 [Borrelia miyamotoi]WAZ91568.1 hypothetical protein O5398_05385 [Borrelia miyamotoi]WAZ92856.1 hypothetical protein O5402_05400 [Borrelia miyamotoi]
MLLRKASWQLMTKFFGKYVIFCGFVFLILACSSIGLENFEGLSRNSKYIRLIFNKNKISLRHYFTISGKFNLRYKEPLFLQCGNNIVASFLFGRYRKIGNAYIHTFFSVGRDISLKVYLELVKAGKFIIINGSGETLKTIVFSHLPDSEDILVQNNKII